MEIFLKDYKTPDFYIKNCDITFEIFDDFIKVTSLLNIQRDNVNQKDLVLDALDLELLELYVDDNVCSEYIKSSESITIKNVEDSFTLKIVNKIYPNSNHELEGLYRSGEILCTQNEPEGFRRITPFIDRPDNMTIFRTTIIASKSRYPILLGNGNLESSCDLDDDRHKIIWSDPFPKPSYLFAIVAGDLGFIKDEFYTKSSKKVELCIYTDRGNESKCYHAMTSLKKAMKWDEDVYDREYDLDIYNIVAVDSFNMGAMENKGLNIFNSAYVLASSSSATDSDFMGVESVIAHEYFHNWSGNRITCRNWFELTLKEGLTVFRDQSFSEDMNSKELERLKSIKTLKERQFVEDASPTAHPIKPSSYIAVNNFYTATVYEKGSEVIRMLHTMLGVKVFKKAMDIYFDTYDGKAVGSDEFLECMSKASGRDLSQFKRWYNQYKTPILEVTSSYEKNRFMVGLQQIIPDTLDGKKQLPYHYPLKVALFSEDGKILLEDTLEIKKEYEEFSFTTSTKPVLSLNRAFSSPIIIKQEDTNYPFLMKYEKDGYSRYEATNLLALRELNSRIDKNSSDTLFLDSYGYLLKDEIDDAFRAYLLDLPSLLSIASQREIIDFDDISSARESLFRDIAIIYSSELLEIYKKNHNPQDSSISAISIAKRSIKNRVLKILSYGVDVYDLAKEQYFNSLTMSDKIASFEILLDSGYKDEIKEHFYSAYKNDTLVIQKYFTLLALQDKQSILSEVLELESNEAYDKFVPNLLRSLVGAFGRNYRYFHSKDASGYKFMISKILEVDSYNHQMASSLAQTFKLYKKMNKINQNLMKIELEKLLDNQCLSKNVYEIVSKIVKN